MRAFLERGINVFAWNYRGYGMSKGKTSPGSFKQDITAILKYCRNDLGLTGKLGVYGRSLGGVATSYVSNMCDMVIVDRTFASLDAIAVNLAKNINLAIGRKIVSHALKLGSCGWQV
jgi:alpha/beta superfamily hydrolase